MAADLAVALTAGRLRGRLSRTCRWQDRQRGLMIGLGTFMAVT